MTWTESATDKFNDYLARLRPGLSGSGADPGEVAEDIRRHVLQELAVSKLTVVTSEDVDRVLRRLGTPEATSVPPPSTNPSVKSEPRPTHAKSSHGVALFFGVILPGAVILFELVCHMCAAVLFNPLPDWWHVSLVAAVPIINALTWKAVRDGKNSWYARLGAANAFALGITCYYSLLFSTVTPFALIGLVFFGFGLLPLAPLLSLFATVRFRVLLGLNAEGRCPGLSWGLGGAAVALTLVALPIVLTRHWSQVAADGEPKDRLKAIERLRAFGREHILLADCYSTTGWGNDAPLGIHFHGKPVPPNAARNIYYRVTGEAFNAVPPPQLSFGLSRWDYLDEFSWDNEQGGTVVGGRLKGLSLGQSRLDALVDADAAWAYTEWTLEFKNVAIQDREARAQIALPPGGVVSRLTLWVNGEEREAAFAGSGQVRAAYQKVVNVQRRDPVLVTSSGPDRVLMQCFPVPRNGGTIKVRLGITAPLQLPDPETAVVVWPRFIERNFNVPGQLEHALWMESKQPVISPPDGFRVDSSKPGVLALRARIRDQVLSAPSSVVRLRRDAAIRETWVRDPRTDEDYFIRQSIMSLSEAPPKRAVFVVDGSRSMTPLMPVVAEALADLPEGMEFAVVIARDEVEVISSGFKRTDATSKQSIVASLRRAKGAGGQDNLPALTRAWDLAAEQPHGAVIWIHGPQPQLLESDEALQQRFDWRPPSTGSGPAFYELQISPGPDRVIEKLNSKLLLRTVARHGTVGEDLKRLLAGWQGKASTLAGFRERLPASAVPVAQRGKESSKHLSRLWAHDEVLRLVAARKTDQAVKLAGLHQLVTPVSGAVVLETRQQFDRAGLQPVDPQSVPMVPEPGTLALLTLGGCALAWRIWRSRATRNGIKS